jgi:predicted nucleic acid-binding protein
MHITFDTTFFVAHYFSQESKILERTREILRRSRLQGNRGIVPTIVLAEFYVQAGKRSGAAEAQRRCDEISESGLEIISLDRTVSMKAAVLRHRYQEKIPWGDCLVAATAIECASQYIITQDPEFKSFKEIKSKRIEEITI